MIHHANHLRPNPDGTKVGGHQASSASMASILTALYFDFLKAGDRVSVKPHASPAYHAVQYLLGNLDRSYLPTLRAHHGLQAYPSRTKDPDPVDFSTGSVGLGAAAPAFAALVHRYADLHFGGLPDRRFVAIMGDAELDEGNVWEAVTEEHLRGLGNVLWIVDLNRQSLDRVVPGIRAAQLKSLFRESHWHVTEAKYGRRLKAVAGRPGGAALLQRIDEMANEEYQFLIRQRGFELRNRLIGAGPDSSAVEAAIAGLSDDDLATVVSDLGGHDVEELLRVFHEADAVTDRPSIVFAYTIKGWGLPIAGDPLNHSALLTGEQIDDLRRLLEIGEDEWPRFPAESIEAGVCADAARRLREPDVEDRPILPASTVPLSLPTRQAPNTSSQEAFGRLVSEFARIPELSKRVVTTSADVAISTNLGAWINRVGVFSTSEQPDYTTEGPRLLRWQPGPKGQHIELGIAETNLFLLLGQLGLSAELAGEHLLPIGTVYDPFVARGLDALIYSLYSGAKMVVVGTPSGISLSPEGGAHQSIVTPSLGLELPNLNSFEPCFAREVEWTLLEGLRLCCDRESGRSTYLRLSTKNVDQALLDGAMARLGEDALREQVLAGGYRLIDWRSDAGELAGSIDPHSVVQIATCGTMVPEAIEAARRLHQEGIAANVLNVTSARRLYEGMQQARRRQCLDATADTSMAGHFATLIPREERRSPIVTVIDGASHALAFLGSVFGAPLVPLGLHDFGQSGWRDELYRDAGIDVESIVAAAYAALDLVAD